MLTTTKYSSLCSTDFVGDTVSFRDSLFSRLFEMILNLHSGGLLSLHGGMFVRCLLHSDSTPIDDLPICCIYRERFGTMTTMTAMTVL